MMFSRLLRKPATAWFLALLPVALLIIVRAGIIAEGDVFWEARSGLQIIGGQSIVHGDTWSWTMSGVKWIPNSWAWDVVLGHAWRWGGIFGLGMVGLVGSSLLFGLLVVQSRRLGAGPYATGIAALFACLVLAMWLTPRPQLATYILSIVVVALTGASLTAKNLKQYAAFIVTLGMAQVVAINLHFEASSFIAIVPSACFAWAIYEVRDGRSISPKFILTVTIPTITVVLATLINPIGWDIFAHSWDVRNISSGTIAEWAPGWRSIQGVPAILITSVIAIRAWRMGRPLTAGALACVILLTITTVRFAPFTALFAMPEMASWITVKNRQTAIGKRSLPFTISAAAVLVLILLPMAIQRLPHLGHPNNKTFSIAAVESLPSGCRLLNEYEQGGLVTLYRPDIKVSFDGRNDFYGLGPLNEQRGVWANRIDSEQWLQTHNVTCVLTHFTKNSRPLLNLLQTDPTWHFTAFGSDLVGVKTPT